MTRHNKEVDPIKSRRARGARQDGEYFING